MITNKLTFTIAVLILMLSFNISTAQTKVGIRTGINFSQVNAKDRNGKSISTQSIPGFHLGLTVDVPIAGDFYVQPAILYSGKGFKENKSELGYGNGFRATASYMELPVNLLYKPKLGIGNLILGAGPYLGLGIGGSWKTAGPIVVGDIMMEGKGDVIFKNDIKDGESGNFLYGKPLDYGVNFLIGYEFMKQFSVQFNAQIGVANLQPKYSGVKPKDEMRNNGYGISLGYKF